MKNLNLIASLLIATSLAPMALAQDISIEADENLTVQPAGPRQGANGLRFLNVQGPDNGTFASFGVFSINPANASGSLSGYSGIRFQVTQANAGFTISDGIFGLFLVQEQTQPFLQTNANLTFDVTNSPSGLDADLNPSGAPLIKVSTLTHYSVLNPSGTTYDISLDLSGPAGSFISSAIANGERLRFAFAVAPESLDLSADGNFAGYDNSTRPGPTLVFDFPNAVNGTLNLTDWSGNTDAESATFEIFDGSTGDIIESIPGVNLTADGSFGFDPLTNSGTYRLRAKVSHWLSKDLGSFDFGSRITGANGDLLNGDIDGDNSVTIFDYIELSGAFDLSVGQTGFLRNADLDGDTSITIFDYIILSNNFDLSGE